MFLQRIKQSAKLDTNQPPESYVQDSVPSQEYIREKTNIEGVTA